MVKIIIQDGEHIRAFEAENINVNDILLRLPTMLHEVFNSKTRCNASVPLPVAASSGARTLSNASSSRVKPRPLFESPKIKVDREPHKPGCCPRVSWKGTSREKVCNRDKIYKGGLCYYHWKKAYPHY